MEAHLVRAGRPDALLSITPIQLHTDNQLGVVVLVAGSSFLRFDPFPVRFDFKFDKKSLISVKVKTA